LLRNLRFVLAESPCEASKGLRPLSQGITATNKFLLSLPECEDSAEYAFRSWRVASFEPECQWSHFWRAQDAPGRG